MFIYFEDTSGIIHGIDSTNIKLVLNFNTKVYTVWTNFADTPIDISEHEHEYIMDLLKTTIPPQRI